MMRHLLLLLLLLPAACAAPPPQSDPAAARETWGLAQYLIIRHQYAEAADELRKAIRLDPTEGRYRLYLGDVLEAQGRHKEAFDVFETALRDLSPDTPYEEELLYRTALLAGVKLRQVTEAEKLLDRLPPDSPRRPDLRAALDLAAGRPREALERLNAARTEGLDPDLAARILYHAALAYRQLDAEEAAMAALHRAVGLARRPAAVRDLAALFYELRGTEPPWPDAPPPQGDAR